MSHTLGNPPTAILTAEGRMDWTNQPLAFHPAAFSTVPVTLVCSSSYYFGGYGKSDGATYQCCTDSTDRTCSVTTYANQQAKVVILDDLDADKWRIGATVPYNVHGSMTATSVGAFIYVCGGIYMQDPKDAKFPANPDNCVKYNPESNEFAAIAALPIAVDSAASASDGERVFIFGGRQAQRRLNTDAFDFVQIYSPATNTWASNLFENVGGVPRMPAPRAGSAAVYHQGSFWVLGGESKQVGAHNEVFLFNPVANTWQTAPPLPSRFHGMGAVVNPADNAVYTAGGGRTLIGHESDSVYKLNPCVPVADDLRAGLAACGQHRQCNEAEYCETAASDKSEAVLAGCKPCPYCLASATVCPAKCDASVASFMVDKPKKMSKSKLTAFLRNEYPAHTQAPGGSHLLCRSTTTTTATTVRKCTDGRVDLADCNLPDRGCNLPSVVGDAYRAACPVQCGICERWWF